MSQDRALSPLAVRWLVRLGLCLWLMSACAVVWEVLSLQMPNSPFHVGVLSGPIGQLRSFSFGLGTGALVLSWLWPALFLAGEGRAVLVLITLGALLQVAALFYAATQGMVGVQLLDPRLDARLVIYLRALAHALSFAGLAVITLRALRRSRSS